MRLQRIGRKNNPSYRVVVVDSRQGPKSGTFVDMLGFYEPKAGTVRIDGEKAKSWLSRGVQASPTVHNMLVSKQVIAAEKIVGVAAKKEEVSADAAQTASTASTDVAA